MRDGVPTVCVPSPAGGCTRPYHDTADVNGGGPHGEHNAVADVNGGKMNGFIRQRDAVEHRHAVMPTTRRAPLAAAPDVMGYHTAAEIPNYWTYAKDFVLQDHMFEPVKSWSLPDHLYLVSGWSAKCKNRSPMSCVNNIVGPYGLAADSAGPSIRSWPPARRRSTWPGPTSPGCSTPSTSAGRTTCRRARSPTATTTRPRPAPRSGRATTTPGIWNPLPALRGRPAGPPAAQHPGPQLLPACGQDRARCRRSAGSPRPGPTASTRRPASTAGQAYVTAIINAAMKSPDWNSTAIFLQLGRLGRLLRPRGAARRSTRTATACGSRGSSSPRTPSGVSSTTRRSAATPT